MRATDRNTVSTIMVVSNGSGVLFGLDQVVENSINDYSFPECTYCLESAIVLSIDYSLYSSYISEFVFTGTRDRWHIRFQVGSF